ncbi:MAG: four helix bundle protein [Bacteroidales bacterium]|nr:four helix bundle protein [Bacteroidales bacterium]
MLKNENVVREKGFKFAIRIVRLYQYLTNIQNSNRELILSKQVLRSGTSVGANIRESRNAQTVKDFLTKLYIASKEADETGYWLELLKETGYISEEQFESINQDCEEIMKLLASIIKTTKKNNPDLK